MLPGGGAFLLGKLGGLTSSGSGGGLLDGAFLDGREGGGGFLLGRLGTEFSGSGGTLCAKFRPGRLGGRSGDRGSGSGGGGR